MDGSDGLRLTLSGARSVESHVQSELSSRVFGYIDFGLFTAREAVFPALLGEYGATLVDWRMAIHGTFDADGTFRSADESEHWKVVALLLLCDSGM